MKPKVSVISGFYNRANYLERTLDSLCTQSLRDIEIIVFDDASKDNTKEKIENYIRVNNEKRIRPIFHLENIGFTRGLINAIDQSKGEYIAIQGSGDESTSDRLLKQSNFLDKNLGAGVVGCHFINISDSGSDSVIRRPDASRTTLESLQRKNVFAHGDVMMRRSVYEEAGGYRPIFKYSADYDLWLRMITISKFGTIPEILYKRHMLSDGVSYNPEKAIQMVKYHALGWGLSFRPEGYNEIVEEHGDSPIIDKVVPDSDRKVQKKIIRLCLRFAYFAQFDHASSVARRIRPRLLGEIISRALNFSPFQKTIRIAGRFSKGE